MNRIWFELMMVVVALTAGLFSGYYFQRRNAALQRKIGAQSAPQLRDPGSAVAPAPFVIALVVGFALIAGAAQWLLAGDRFYDAPQARAAALSVIAGVVLIGFGQLFLNAAGTIGLVKKHYGKPDLKYALERFYNASSKISFPLLIILIVIATLIVVAAGVRFELLSLTPKMSFELGGWAPAVTVLYIVAATCIVLLLHGLEGAANTLLLISAIVVFYVTLGVDEFFLNAFAAAVIAAALASLRFNLYPARLRMPLSGTAAIGFVFAVLTVISRQKTVAALLLALPLIVVVLVAGGLMLSMLERTMSVDQRKGD